MQNGRVESFNGRLRDECLNANWFPTMNEAKQLGRAFNETHTGALAEELRRVVGELLR